MHLSTIHTMRNEEISGRHDQLVLGLPSASLESHFNFYSYLFRNSFKAS